MVHEAGVERIIHSHVHSHIGHGGFVFSMFAYSLHDPQPSRFGGFLCGLQFPPSVPSRVYDLVFILR